MARQVGNPGMGPNVHYHETGLPSTHNREQLEFTSSFPADRVTHKHHTPKGEDDHAGQRQYRAPGNRQMKEGPALSRAVERQGIYGDRAPRFGTIGSGAVGPDRKGDWDHKTGKSRGAGFEPGNGGRKGLSASG